MPHFSKKSLERIVWSTSNEYRERKLHLPGFISKEEMETGGLSDPNVPFRTGLIVTGLNHLQILPEQV